MMRTLLAALTLLPFAGCVSASKVYEVRPGIYSISSTGDGFSTADRVRDSVLSRATAHCAGMGKRLAVEDETSERTRMNIDTTINVTFRCVP